GIKSRAELAAAERLVQDRLRRAWMDAGVTLVDPATTYFGLDVQIGPDTILHPGTFIEGQTRIGAACEIGPGARLVDATVGDRCRIGGSLLEGCTLEDEVDVGTFNHLRAGAYLCTGVHLGNYAEVKGARLGPGVKMGHFSYIGNATVGAETNVGAG